MSASFSNSDFAVFKAIAEQSAFALYSAFIYSEASEKKRMDADLQVAQRNPAHPPSRPRRRTHAAFQISGINIPARQVSGDYFDYIRVDPKAGSAWRSRMSRARVVPASLIMAMCRSVLRSQASRQPLRRPMSCAQGEPPDLPGHQGGYVHQHGLRRSSTMTDRIRSPSAAPATMRRLLYSAKAIHGQSPGSTRPGMALGIDSGDVFDRITGDFSVTLESSDDCLILYTDGVTEALDRKGY